MRYDFNRLSKQLRFHEGVEHTVYKDHLGIETIGVGRNLVDRGLLDSEIDILLTNDVEIVEEDLDRNLPIWRSLDDVRQRCLIDLVFNMGISRFLLFRNTIALIKQQDWEGASKELLDSKYAEQVGARAVRIAEMLKTGQASGDF